MTTHQCRCLSLFYHSLRSRSNLKSNSRLRGLSEIGSRRQQLRCSVQSELALRNDLQYCPGHILTSLTQSTSHRHSMGKLQTHPRLRNKHPRRLDTRHLTRKIYSKMRLSLNLSKVLWRRVQSSLVSRHLKIYPRCCSLRNMLLRVVDKPKHFKPPGI